MIPILFDSTATAFNTNGIGRLSEAISCMVEEERNGIYEMEMVYPVTGVRYGDLQTSRIIVVKASDRAGLQPFRIYKISRPIGGRVTIYARHISYQLNFIPFKPFTATSLANALQGFKTNALEPCPFTFTADFTSSSGAAYNTPSSIRSCLGGSSGSIIDRYGNGAEWEFDNYNCILHAHRGENRGVVLRYGKNIVDLKQEENIENTITGVLPFWKSEDVQVYLDAPVESPTASRYPFPRTVVKDFSDKFENPPTKAALQAYAEAYVSASGIGVPKVSIDVNFVNLADTLDYAEFASIASVALCDTVTVRFEKLGVDTTAKVVRLRYDVLKERTSEITVGDLRGSLATTIEDQIEAVNLRPTYAETQRSIDRATGTLDAGKRGHAVFGRTEDGWANELYFVDNENIYSAIQVLRLNMNGIGFSSSGIGGPYAQSWTLDGHLTLGGVNGAYGDLLILDENAVPTIQVDKEGLKLWKIQAAGYLYNGVLYADAEHTTVITPTAGSYYFDYVTYVTYAYSNGQYSQVSGNQGLLAKMTHDGLGLYEGDIDLKWNGQTGLKFTAGSGGASDILRIGDFMVANQANAGRQILESSDEMTGMSGEPAIGQYFLWAGWRSDNDFAFAVENRGGGGADVTKIQGQLLVNGIDVMDYIAEMSVDDDQTSEGGETYDGVTVDLSSSPPPEE